MRRCSHLFIVLVISSCDNCLFIRNFLVDFSRTSCHAVRLSFANFVYAFLATKWTSVASDQQTKLSDFSSLICSVTLSELSSRSDFTEWQPFSVEFKSQLAHLILRYATSRGKSVDDKTFNILLDLLTSDLYELRLAALQFLARALPRSPSSVAENCQAEEVADDVSPPVDCNCDEATAVLLPRVQNSSSGRSLQSLLIGMMTETESNGECLALVRKLHCRFKFFF